jgi:hypothetical protein
MKNLVFLATLLCLGRGVHAQTILWNQKSTPLQRNKLLVEMCNLPWTFSDGFVQLGENFKQDK